jgi:hypothetical protein
MTTDSIAHRYQTTFSIKDKRFDMAQLRNYHLAISLGDTSLRICCIDQISNRCLWIESYILHTITPSVRMQAIEQLWKVHPLLANNWWNTVILCIENQQYTLIPKSLFNAKDIDAYLNLATASDHALAKYYVHANLGVVLAFNIDAVLLNWFQTIYEQTTFHTIHQASSLISGLSISNYLNHKNLRPSPQIFAMAESDHLHILVMTKAKLFYYNRFPYHDSDELLQYILIVMVTLELDPSSQEIIISGNITKNSLTHRKLQNYIRKVTFSERLPHLKFGWSFKDSILIQYFDLLSIYTCQNLS